MPRNNKKKIIISVTNDLVTDQRVHKTALSLIGFGYDVLLVGRILHHSLPISRDYQIKRLKLLFSKGFFFYAEYNIRLFLFLLFKKAFIFLSNDLDTLPANFLASKIRNKKLVYDSHEYFTEVPELINRKGIRKIWGSIERIILPKVRYSYTVCQSIADIYNKKYGVQTKVVRNIPLCNYSYNKGKKLFSDLKNKRIILYQGSLNIGRGIEQVIDAMKYVEDATFVVIGDGDIKRMIETKIKDCGYDEKIILVGRLAFNEIYAYTKLASIGISVEESLGLNYHYSLPNKLFDYIRAEVPILASKLPEVEKLITKYKIGCFIDNHKPKHIAERINYMLQATGERALWKENLVIASKELCWENEERILQTLF
jgi:glycosyltransferase involved in cell wall biosynthesis